MTSCSLICCGGAAGAKAAASPSTCGLSRGRSTIATLPRLAGTRAATADDSKRQQHHPNTPDNQTRGTDLPRSSRTRNTRAWPSVAMADVAANSAGEEIVRTHPARLRVMLPLPLAEPLDYLAPEGIATPEPGSFVRVALGSRQVFGVVWEGEGGEGLPLDRLKSILEILPAPPLRPEMRRFIDRVATYTLSPPGMVLKMAMSIEEALLPRAPRRVCVMTADGLTALESADAETKLTAARRRALQALRGEGACAATELARRAGCTAGVVRGLIAGGLVAEDFVSGEPAAEPAPDWRADGPALSCDQERAAERLVARVHEAGFSVTVLDGVTGSGKTETYFAAIAAALAAGRQVLVLLPEIALGAQWLERFKRRFGTLPAEWHSDISQSARRDTWRAVASGKTRIVVGARSALFLPFPELGLIIVDEEHDASYKQEDGVCYQARDMAVLRASLAGIPIVLVSATPSLETVQNVAARRYEALHLPYRHGGALLPVIGPVDLRTDKPPRQSWLSPTLRQALSETLAAGEQAMLFLNR